MVMSSVATFLFTDLVGSTALATGMSAENADHIRRTHFEMLRAVVDATGGTEIKNLGDGLMVAFTSPSRALACAVGMQQAVEHHNTRSPVSLGLRVGLAVGEASEEAGDYFGQPVVEAARLCALAEAGQILATDLVRLTVGRHAAQEFVPLGELELKGFPAPVPAVEVCWEQEAVSGPAGDRIPYPSQLLRASSDALFAFFGRAGELAELQRLGKEAAAERALRLALIAGEPGIGKTSLVAHATRAAATGGANVVYGACEEGLTAPFQPWAGALSHLVAHLDPTLLAEHVARYGSLVARIAPVLTTLVDCRAAAPPSQGADAETERFLLFEAVAGLLQAASASYPLIVVLDDLHWADSASLSLLRHLLRSGSALAVLVIVTYRDSDVHRGHPLAAFVADMHREQGRSRRLVLRGLSDGEIIELVEAAAGHDLPSEGVDLAHALQRETDGNPYYVSELLRHLFYSGAFRLGPDGRWSLEADLADLGLPGSIRDVVTTRIGRLGEDAAHNLAIAAVIGREFDLGVLAEVCELDEERLLDLMDSAITAAVVREGEPGRFQFVHALIPHTLYQGLSATRRQRIHRRVAEALEGMDREVRPRATELARHWLAATRPADVSQAVRYARQAAEEALAALAPQDAIGWFEQALELLVGQPANQSFQRSRASLLVGLGNAQRQAGTGDYRATLREAADLSRQIGANDLLVAAALAGARGSHVTAVADHETLALLSAALEAVGPADSPERARLLVALADALEPHEWRRAQELALEALEVAGRLDQDEARLAVLVGAMGPLAHPSFAERRRIYSTVAVDLADRLGHPLWRSLARFYRMYTRVETADLEGTDRDLNEMTDIAERTTLPLLVWQLRLSTAWRHLLAGRLEHAEADIEEAFALGSASGQPEAVGCYAGQMFNLRRHQGRIGEVAEFFLDAAEAMPAMPALRAASCFLHCELGRPDVAQVAFEQDRETGFSLYPHDLTWSVAMVELAHVATELGDRHGARLLYGLLEPYSGSVTFNMGVDLGPVDRSLGRLAGTLGRLDAAEAYFRQALSTLERFTAPYWEATTLLDYADLLERTGQPAVRPRRDRALLLAERFGFIGLEDRARSGL